MIFETCIPPAFVDTDREREILRVPMADCLDQLQLGLAQPYIYLSLPAILAGFVRVDPRLSPFSSYCNVNVRPGTARVRSFMADSDRVSRRSLADGRPA